MTRPHPPLALTALLLLTPPAAAQQAPAGPGNPFRLNAVEQAYLNQVLETWESESAKIQTFSCPFTRWDYNAFSPDYRIAFSVDDGEVSYQKPDKGSFRITTVRRWTPKPVAPGQGPPAGPAQGEHIEQPDLIGEHWVCDGKNVYEYQHHQSPKVLRVQPIPPEMQGKAIVDGPLPFLFGAEADKLKQRYWMKIMPAPESGVIHIAAAPRFQADAANYKGVELRLDQHRMLPMGMQITQPDGSRSAYQFRLEEAKVNARRDRLWSMLFQSPRTPLGWKRIVEPMPARQAAAAAQPPR